MKKNTETTTPKGKKETSLKDALSSNLSRGKVLPDKKD